MTPETSRSPRFSIVVPAFQAATTIAETLDGILSQTFSDWECVVVDDGSTDRTGSVADAYGQADPRVRVIHQDNQGTAGAYNAGVSLASGDFVVLCSADDVLLPKHLATMSAFIESEAGYDIYTANGYRWSPDEPKKPMNQQSPGDSPSSMELADLIRYCFYGVGAAYKRPWFEKVGGYRQGVYAEDYDFWLRAMAMGARHRYLPEPLSLFRVSPTQKSASAERVYLSDIRLVSDLKRDFELTPWEVHAVDQTMQERERLIAELGAKPSLYRRLIRPSARWIVYRFVGPRRAQSWWRSIRYGLWRLVRG